MFGDPEVPNAWNLPLLSGETDPNKKDAAFSNQDSPPSASTSETKDFGAEISFLQEEFTQSLDTANSEREKTTEAQKQEMARISSATSTLGTDIQDLSNFVKSTFQAQDKVIVSLKAGQDAIDDKMSVLANEFGTQMSGVTTLITDLKREIIRMTHASARATPHEKQVMAVQALQFDDTFIGNLAAPSGGPGN